MVVSSPSTVAGLLKNVENGLIAAPNEEAANTYLILKRHGGTRLEVVSGFKREDESRTWLILTREMVYQSFSLKCQ